MPLSSMEDLLALNNKRHYSDLDPIKTQFGEYGFRIRTLSEEEHSDIIAVQFAKGGNRTRKGVKESDSRFIAASIVNENNELMFPGDDGYQNVMTWPSAVTIPLIQSIREFNGLTSVEDEEKNSETTSGQSPSTPCVDSPELLTETNSEAA